MKTELQPWRPLSDFDIISNRLHDFLPGFWTKNSSFNVDNWQPAVDITEDDKQYLITADLPEVTKENLNVTISERILTISGEREQLKEDVKKTYHRIERLHGNYARSFRLPEDVSEENLNAEFKDGVLKITLLKDPLKKKKRAKQIAIH